jgi:tRNA-intron endonuclease, archaea type
MVVEVFYSVMLCSIRKKQYLDNIFHIFFCFFFDIKQRTRIYRNFVFLRKVKNQHKNSTFLNQIITLLSMGILIEDTVVEDSDIARELWNRQQFGSKGEKGKVVFSNLEALYLLESGKITVLGGKTNKKEYAFESLAKYFAKKEKQLLIRYAVYAHLRKAGYVVKTALKFGADFRVYERGIKVGEDHAKWIVFAVHESQTQSWREFSAKGRVAHSTRKKLLIAVVDDDLDVTYFQVDWTKP